MTYGFVIQLVFCKKKCGISVLVTPFLSGAPPLKKNPGSAPDGGFSKTNTRKENVPRSIGISKGEEVGGGGVLKTSLLVGEVMEIFWNFTLY